MQYDFLGIGHEESFTLKTSWRVVRNWRRTYPWMRRKAVNHLAPRLAFFISVLAIFAHAIWAAKTHCNVNFQRGGGIVTLTAAALYAVIEWHAPKGGLWSGGLVEKLHIWNPLFLLPFLGGTGTLIWAYGDLLPWFGSTGCH